LAAQDRRTDYRHVPLAIARRALWRTHTWRREGAWIVGEPRPDYNAAGRAG
jgi:hypothetical protein